MRRGTTPTININVKGCNISEFTTVYVTFKQGTKEVTKTGESLSINDNVISITLTQEDTLIFNSMEKVVNIQIRAVNEEGVAIASNIRQISVEDILKEGVI